MSVVGGARAHMSGCGGLSPLPGNRQWKDQGSHFLGLQSQTGPPRVSVCLSAQLRAEPECLASRLWPTMSELELVILS